MAVEIERMVRLEEKEVEGKTFYLLKVGRADHGKPVYRVWVQPSLVVYAKDRWSGDREFPQLTLPARGVELVKGQKDLILRRGEKNLFIFHVACGYRGSSDFELVEPAEVFPFVLYRSERGSLGVSRGAMVLTDKEVVRLRYRRSGRLYGASPSGQAIIHLDGKVEELEGELEDALGSL